MPLTKLQFKPGINREVTSYSNEGGWRDCDKVRFRFGYPEKIGGWEKYSQNTYEGSARALHNWLALNGSNYLGVGTHLKYYIEEGQQFHDITPIRATTSAGDATFSANELFTCSSISGAPFTYGETITGGTSGATGVVKSDINGVGVLVALGGRSGIFSTGETITGGTSGATATLDSTSLSTTLTVMEASHGAEQFDFVTFSGTTSLGGTVTNSVLNKEYQIQKIISTGVFEVTLEDAPSFAQADVNGAVSSSTNVTVDGNSGTIVAGMRVQGTGISGVVTVSTVTSQTAIVLDTAVTLSDNTALTFGDITTGGSSSVAEYQINVGLDTTVNGTGWGVGTWGRGTWSSAAPGGLSTINELRLWTHDNIGEDLLMCPRDSSIYYWDKTGGLASRAEELSAATTGLASGTKTSVPQIAKQILVSDRDRHTIAFGCDNVGANSSDTQGDGVQDSLLIRFSSQEDPVDWWPTADNTAGDLRLGAGSTFMQALETKREILIWTDTALTSMRFIGDPFTFGLQQISSGITIMSPYSAAASGDFVFWMGLDTFYIYAGQTQQLPCSVKDKVFLDFNFAQKSKVVSAVNSEFTEITWFYPSAASDDNDRYVTYNYGEKVWTYGSIARTSWVDRGTRDYPIGAGSNYLYNHEYGYDDDGSAMSSYIESAAMDIADGDRFAYIRKLIPDLTFDGSVALSSPQAEFTLKARNNPGADFDSTSSGISVRTQTTPVEEYTEQLDMRVRGRSFALRVESSALGSKWKLGSPRIDIRPDGRR